MSNQSFDPRTDVLERLAFAQQLFRADIRSMSTADLATTCGGQSRCGYDFIFEMVGFYETLAGLLNNGPSDIEGPQGGWVQAPKEFCDLAPAVAKLNAAADGFTEAIRSYQGDFVKDVFPSPVGPFTPLGMANLAIWHTMYHSGQLNYIQTINGDVDFHWIPGDN